MPAKDIIQFAYNIKPAQLSGGPSWITAQGYVIDAKVDDSVIPDLQKLPPPQRTDQMRLMIRSLLADRFKLVLSQDNKEMPIYGLVVAKGGPKLTPTAYAPPDPNTQPPSSPAPMQSRPHLLISPGKISAVNQPISGLADLLALLPDLGGRMVQDETGIKGNYDFEMTFTQEVPFPGAATGAGNPSASSSDSSGPSIFTALEEQMGLRLESTKGPVQVYTIEHIEEPSEN